ncbi:hypothetical protein CY34DRAFT_804675 [Suillus luteus UH-Slu-Lm8-n1]|uniref:Uncharacterized protein n=1 Tax=Suillus luteus UH-Slu-Lm8-n1 TaxID=930992 RepID=A0A0D0AXY7_9AGAM|nr:hypothetical protein CY34DRAFT_804675 [Suillus luteus UH-Slu-Lm8-n1]
MGLFNQTLGFQRVTSFLSPICDLWMIQQVSFIKIQDSVVPSSDPTSPHQVHDAFDIVRSVSESLYTNHIFVHRPDINPLPTDSSLRRDGYDELHLMALGT